jgi:hypothetical protein
MPPELRDLAPGWAHYQARSAVRVIPDRARGSLFGSPGQVCSIRPLPRRAIQRSPPADPVPATVSRVSEQGRHSTSRPGQPARQCPTPE